MTPPRRVIGGLGNVMFQHAFVVAERRRRHLDGHFPHSADWFAGCEDEIKQLFGVGIGRDARVSIHVRRTDYLDESREQFALPLAYYARAMMHFPHDRFLVCSDDLPWCRANFVGAQFDFSAHANEVEDLNAMAACQHNIIANSTFSFWAAFLNPNPGRTVVAPATWERGGWCPALPPDWIRA